MGGRNMIHRKKEKIVIRQEENYNYSLIIDGRTLQKKLAEDTQ